MMTRIQPDRSHRRITCWAVTLATIAVLAVTAGCDDNKSKTKTQSASSGNSIPSIDSLLIPYPVPAGQTVEIAADISGDPGQNLDWVVTPETGGGTFDPATGTVSFNAQGEAHLSVSYTAPDIIGHYTPDISVTDEDDDTSDATLSIDVRGVGAALFSDATFVNYNPGDYWMEASNVEASLDSRGYTVTPFSGTQASDFMAAVQGKAALSIPRLFTNLDTALDSAAKSAIEQFVANGGLLIVNDDSYRAPTLLNAVFGYGLSTSVSPANLNLSTQLSSDSPFAGGTNSLPWYSQTWAVDPVYFPSQTQPIYVDGVGRASVFLIPHGNGHILYLGWDWYNAAPNGSNDGGWLDVLGAAMNAAETGSF